MIVLILPTNTSINMFQPLNEWASECLFTYMKQHIDIHSSSVFLQMTIRICKLFPLLLLLLLLLLPLLLLLSFHYFLRFSAFLFYFFFSLFHSLQFNAIIVAVILVCCSCYCCCGKYLSYIAISEGKLKRKWKWIVMNDFTIRRKVKKKIYAALQQVWGDFNFLPFASLGQ